MELMELFFKDILFSLGTSANNDIKMWKFTLLVYGVIIKYYLINYCNDEIAVFSLYYVQKVIPNWKY
jgi:hypothetical protein